MFPNFNFIRSTFSPEHLAQIFIDLNQIIDLKRKLALINMTVCAHAFMCSSVETFNPCVLCLSSSIHAESMARWCLSKNLCGIATLSLCLWHTQTHAAFSRILPFHPAISLLAVASNCRSKNTYNMSTERPNSHTQLSLESHTENISASVRFFWAKLQWWKKKENYGNGSCKKKCVQLKK